MTTMTTASPAELLTIDAAEDVLVAHWRSLIGRQSPDLIVSLIVAAHDFDPRFGEHMERCESPRCDRFVVESLRNPDGGLFCPDGCEDDAAMLQRAVMEFYADDGDTRPVPDGWPVMW